VSESVIVLSAGFLLRSTLLDERRVETHTSTISTEGMGG
jgi:hypothetical protein